MIQGQTGWPLIMMLPSYGPDPQTSPITRDRATLGNIMATQENIGQHYGTIGQHYGNMGQHYGII